jgi:hypothetical protein
VLFHVSIGKSVTPCERETALAPAAFANFTVPRLKKQQLEGLRSGIEVVEILFSHAPVPPLLL